jgi:hypothetical protein
MVDREPPRIDWAHIYVEAVNLAADVEEKGDDRRRVDGEPSRRHRLSRSCAIVFSF